MYVYLLIDNLNILNYFSPISIHPLQAVDGLVV